MATYSITTQPQQIISQDAGPDVVTIFNNGPSTVFLSGDSGTAANPDNAYRLPALATMTWKRRRDLWACVINPAFNAGNIIFTPGASLTTSTEGNLAVTNLSRTDRLLSTQFQLPFGDYTMLRTGCEVGAFNRIRMQFLNDNANQGDNVSCNIGVTWLGEKGSMPNNPIIERFPVVPLPTGITTIDLAVKDSFVWFDIVGASASSPGGSIFSTYKLYGNLNSSERAVAIRTNTLVKMFNGATGIGNATSGIDSWVFVAWNLATTANTNWLSFYPTAPSMTFSFEASGPTVGPPVVDVYASGTIDTKLDSITVAAGASGTTTLKTMSLPMDRLITLRPVSGSGSVNVTARPT